MVKVYIGGVYLNKLHTINEGYKALIQAINDNGKTNKKIVEADKEEAKRKAIASGYETPYLCELTMNRFASEGRRKLIKKYGQEKYMKCRPQLEHIEGETIEHRRAREIFKYFEILEWN